ncbi:MAG TPA: thioredoxin [Pyrinomonadaceae bacterium]
MNKYLLMCLAIALLGFNSCAAEQPRKNSGDVGATRDKGVAENVGKVIQITDGSYEQEVLQSQIPVLILFWAPWSAPDRMFAPTIEAVANEYSGKVKVGKVNVDENADLAVKFDIKAIPTVVVIKNRSEQERVVGLTSKEAIGRMLDQQLENNP